jgi:hypothetical protein
MYVVSEDEYRRLTEGEKVTAMVGAAALVNNDHTQKAPEQVGSNDDNKKSVIIHKRKHKCNDCEREYSDKRDLRRHKKKAHVTQDLIIGEETTGAVKRPKDTTNSSDKTVRPRLDPFRQNIRIWKTMF